LSAPHSDFIVIFVEMNATKYSLLDEVDSPVDLKRLAVAQLPEYCRQLREYIIECCAVNPGHLGSSLGAVELAVALHYVYDTPDDKIIWDVGHQAYAHKIITGRREAFRTNRRIGGISGFPRMCESEYDAFGGGHASVSISAAFGMAKAAQLKGERRHVVAVIGDGSMTGGLAFEGLNNAGADKRDDVLVVLNDNNMAIDPATGALQRYLVHVSMSRKYNAVKRRIWNAFSHIPPLLRLCQKAGNALKQGLLQNSNLFESLGFRYFGRIDGHNVGELVRVLQAMKRIGGPKLLHIITTKGRGYAPAERNQTQWHAPGKFDPATGERMKSPSCADRYQDVFGQTLLDLARRDDRIVGITPAMPTGCSMNVMMHEMPERCFDVGIAEGHAVTFSAGLAAAGMVPFCNIYSSFMQRAYDNVIHDVAIQRLHVVMCLDRSGLVGEDGATHHGAFDMAYMGCIPNVIAAAPRDEAQLRDMMYTASVTDAPFVIRYPRGAGTGVKWRGREFGKVEIGRGEWLREGSGVAVVTIGTTAADASQAVARAVAEGLNPAHFDLRFIRPLDEAAITDIARRFDRIVTVEDGSLRGGVGEAVAALLSRNAIATPVQSLGIGDSFVEHGTPAQLKAQCGYDADAIYAAIIGERDFLV